jgi:hypothetical protein
LITSTALKSQTRSSGYSPEQDVKILKFYPNPATSFITFDFQKGFEKSYSFQIFNFIGKKVFELDNLNPSTIVNLNEFYRGIYVFQLRDHTGKIIESGKFQVMK